MGLVFRAIFIFVGVSLINQFHWIIYVFWAFLILRRFFVKEGGRRLAPTLFVVLLVIETTDIIFVLTPLLFLGLRALYFALGSLMGLFHQLHYGLAAISCFCGGKIFLTDLYRVPIGIALGIVGGILTLSIALSLIFKPASLILDKTTGNSQH